MPVSFSVFYQRFKVQPNYLLTRTTSFLSQPTTAPSQTQLQFRPLYYLVTQSSGIKDSFFDQPKKFGYNNKVSTVSVRHLCLRIIPKLFPGSFKESSQLQQLRLKSGYNLFIKEKFKEFEQQNDFQSPQEIISSLAKQWRRLDDKVKEDFNRRAFEGFALKQSKDQQQSKQDKQQQQTQQKQQEKHQWDEQKKDDEQKSQTQQKPEINRQKPEVKRRKKTKPRFPAFMDLIQQEAMDSEDDLDEIMQRIEESGAGEEVLKVARREYKNLRMMGEINPGYASSRAYLEVLADLPWQKTSKDNQATENPSNQPSPLPLQQARDLLERDHYGLEKIKDRIVEHVAVLRLKGMDTAAPILCFVGPPGVGKTSLAKSVAEVLQRPFTRISLGGVRDEAEIRGHRRTYIGSMPGRIIAAIRKVGVKDPVLLLDELDKMGRDARHDPSAALLEILDPEQNHNFVDTYLGLPFDLSKVVFLATANQLNNVPPPLLDRLEVISLSGYTLEEKIAIAERHLVPKVISDHGFDKDKVIFPNDILQLLVTQYTAEAGVRGFTRMIASICRHVAVDVVSKRDKDESHTSKGGDLEVAVDESLVRKVLGPRKYTGSEGHRRVSSPGCAAGLVWTSVGGQVQYIECCFIESQSTSPTASLGKLTLTGQIGEVLQESAQIALSWIRSHAVELGLVEHSFIKASLDERKASQQLPNVTSPPVSAASWMFSRNHILTENKMQSGAELTEQPAANISTTSKNQAMIPCLHWDVHVHLPAGAVQKDGPSAGITLAVALISLFSQRKVRKDTAMTGELSLHGLVLPVGGIKEKLLAAHLEGVKQVIIPEQNYPDVENEVPKPIRDVLEIRTVKNLEEVLQYAFEPPYELKHTVSKL